MIHRFVASPPPLDAMKWMLNILGAWSFRPRAFSVGDCMQRLRHEPEREPDTGRTFIEDLSQDDAEHFRSWLSKNLERILNRLETGPCRLSEFLTKSDLDFSLVDDIHDLFGAYAVEDGFGEQVVIHVGLGGDVTTHSAEKYLLTFNDLLAWLNEEDVT